MADTADPLTRTGASSGSRRRVLAVDAARALAIVGMVSVNVGPTEATGLGGYLYLLPHGRASVLFVLLAGIGFSLMTRRVRESVTGRGQLWAVLGWRCTLLLVGGLALQRLGHEVNVILAVYALLFVLAGALVRARGGVLLLVAALGALVGPVLWLAPQVSAGTPFDGRPPQLGDGPVEVLTAVVLTGPYPLLTWFAPFALGMWLGRQDLTSWVLQRRAVVVAAVLALGCPLVARVAAWWRGGLVGDTSWELLLTDAPHGQMPLWIVGATAVSVLVLLGCLAVERRLGSGRLRPLAVLGQMSLTFYVVHLFALAWLRPLPQTLAQGVLISTVMVVLAAVGATLWRRHHRRGPLELALRAPWTWRTRPA
ncbi:acyltransferase family protein [Oceanitalea stevensii]|uniref:DUF418 domain-containing protein n=1 Tax=Oceanitalea stevensii TaxID=2763072 RepID=A0ABR8Z2V4_9MICO|nr:acyltransferase family protein [Oceanitalea stevensii]MBD8062580.1 DUF418 domain-containing protein [Oceanitalea stevensii]